jgi:Flp pilus assembly CpaF family ATPase
MVWLRDRVADRLARQARDRTSEGSWNDADRRAWATELVREGLRELARTAVARGHAPMPHQAEDRIARRVLDSLFGVAGLQPLLDDPGVENININGHDRVFIRRSGGGNERGDPVADSDEDLIDTVRSLAARAGLGERRFDPGHPMLNLELPGGNRLFAIMDLSRRPAVSIRRHLHQHITLDHLTRLGTLTPQVATFLTAAVRGRRNLLIAGGTGAGKTTLLRALATQIDPTERLVTIEDTFELFLDHDTAAHPDCVALQAREPNIEGVGGIDQANLVRHALRMSPDRVIVGEVRGPELVPMLNAMSQGTDGSMGTVHASSARGVFAKLAAYTAQAPERLGVEATNLLIAQAVHLVVHLALDRATGRRVVNDVVEVTGADGSLLIAGNQLFRPGPDNTAVPAAPPSGGLMDALAAAGYPDYTPAGGGRW